MNKQLKVKDGVVIGRGIEWTDFTANPSSGCYHACQWDMPNGQLANCYAEDVADGVAQANYPEGFEHHYWNPKVLKQIANQKNPSKIFVGSMADVFGHWVPEEHIHAILKTTREAYWHTYQFLTKNPVRVKQFQEYIPNNCWIGASMPPDHMWNKPLSMLQKARMLTRTIESLAELQMPVKWISAEPLSWPIDGVLRMYPNAIQWIVIGAASQGKHYMQPNPDYVRSLLEFCDDQGIAVFFKGNLRPSLGMAFDEWREEFPMLTEQTSLF